MSIFSTDELKYVSEVSGIPMAPGDNPSLRFTPMGRTLADHTDGEILAAYLRRPGANDAFDLGGALGVVPLDRAEGACGSLEALCGAILAGRIPVVEHHAAICWFEEDSPLPADHRLTEDGTAWKPLGGPPLPGDCAGLLPAGVASVEFSADLPVWPTAGHHLVGDPHRGVSLYRAKETDEFSFTPCSADPSADFWEPSSRPGSIQCRPGFGVFELPRSPKLDRAIEEHKVYCLISASRVIFPCRISTTSGKVQGAWPGVAREVVITASSRGSVTHKAQVERPGRGMWESRWSVILKGTETGHKWTLSA